MANNSKPELINPPHDIQNRVSGGGPMSEEMQLAADRAVAQLGTVFPDIALEEVEKLRRLYDQAQEDSASRAGAIGKMFQIAHDLRGQGSTFDYPLVTRIGSSLCTFTEKTDATDDVALQVIGLHIDALQVVISQSIQGDGGQIGRDIADGLEAAVEKVIS